MRSRPQTGIQGIEEINEENNHNNLLPLKSESPSDENRNKIDAFKIDVSVFFLYLPCH